MTSDKKQVLEFFEFVADKFADNHGEGWSLSGGNENFKHIRYKSDQEGYESFWNRVKRAVRFYFKATPFLGEEPSYTWLMHPIGRAKIAYKVHIKPDSHTPDVFINGGSILAHWAEDGEYIMLMSPTVGRIVLEMLQNEPNSEYSERILEEMTRIYNERMYK